MVVSAITCKPLALEKWPEHTTTGKFTTLKTEFTQKLKENKEGHDENHQILNTALDNLLGKVDQKEHTIDGKFTNLTTDFTLKLKETNGKYQLLNTSLNNLKGKVDQSEHTMDSKITVK